MQANDLFCTVKMYVGMLRFSGENWNQNDGSDQAMTSQPSGGQKKIDLNTMLTMIRNSVVGSNSRCVNELNTFVSNLMVIWVRTCRLCVY